MPSVETVVCPYCNAFAPVPGGAAAGSRLWCPRCEESFAYRPREGGTGAPAAERFAPSSPPQFMAQPTPAAVPDRDTFRSKAQLLFWILLVIGAVLVLVGGAYVNAHVSAGSPMDFGTFAGVAGTLTGLFFAVGAVAFGWLWYFRVRRSNGATSLFILGNMAALALLSLAGALATQGYRRHLDAGLPPRPKRSPVPEEVVAAAPALAPARLAALGYLPPGVDLVAGIHVAELEESALGKTLFDRPLKFGNTEFRLADLVAVVGLRAGELDHLVLGMRTDEPLSLVLAARTRVPYDQLRVRQALNARSMPGSAGGRSLYQVTLPRWNLTALLWLADEHTLLVGLSRDSLEKAHASGGGTDPLTPPVRAALVERVGPAGPLWVVGHVGDWDKSAAGLALARLPAEWRDRILTVHTFAARAGLADDKVTLTAAVRCADDKAAAGFAKWIAGRPSEKRAPSLAQEGDWVTIQLHTDPDGFRGLLAP